MAYINRIIGHDEKLIGVARLHWIYVINGLFWFLALAYLGSLTEDLIMTMIMTIDRGVTAVNAPYITSVFSYVTPALIKFASYVNLIQAGIGALIFVSAIIKVLVTEIGLTTRRVIHKKGWMAVNIKQIDLEEIRGESIDYGGFGRFLGYGHIKLDCRFIGDIKLPSIAHPENFMKALHKYRATTQDAVSVMVGKGNAAPVEFVAQRPDIPSEPAAVQVSPDIPVTIISRSAMTKADLPDIPKVPVQPQPEVQPDPQPHQPVQPPQPEIQPATQPPKPEVQPDPQAQAAKQLDAEIVSEVVAQVVPKIVKEMVKEGVVPQAGAPAEVQSAPSEEELLSAFDDAAFETKARSVAESVKKRA